MTWMKNQKKGSRRSIFLLVPFVILLAGCATRIGPGNVGIKVDLAGSQRGVEDLPIQTGWVFYNPLSSSVVEYPTYVQTARWTHSPHEGDNPDSPEGANEEISFNSQEGLTVNADISVSYHLLAEKVPFFYVKFRNDDINRFTHNYLRNVARDSFNDVGGHFSVEDIIGARKEEFTTEVRKRVQDAVASIGVEIDQMGFIESPRPPKSVMDAINAKVQATQVALQKQNEVMQAEADAKKSVAQAQGQAESNRTLASSITPQLIEWQKIQLQWQQLSVTDRWIARWNGKVPEVQSGGQTGFLLNIPAPEK